MRNAFSLILVLLLLPALIFAGGSSEASDGEEARVVVYSSHDSDPLNDAVNDFMSRYPDIKVEVVKLGGAEIFSRVEAEANNPLADIVWGASVDTIDSYSEYLQEYVSSEDSNIAEGFKDPERKWYADSLVIYCNFYNKALINGDIPTTWNGLTDPKWKGRIAMANPASSGSAFVQLCSFLFINGTKENNYEEGWPIVEAFYRNLDGKIQSSSGNCHKLVRDGEYAVGLTLEKFAVMYKDDPAVGWYYADEGTAAAPEGIALVKGCKHPTAAKVFIDFILGKDCQERQSVRWARRSVRTDVTPYEGLPALSDLKLLNYDLEWASENHAAVVDRWQEVVINN